MKIREVRIMTAQKQAFAPSDFRGHSRMNLQLFAEGDDGEGDGESEGEGEGKGNDPKDEPEPEKKYSDEDLDRIINQRFARWQKEQQKAVSEAEKLANMSAEEKTNKRIQDLESELSEYKKERALGQMAAQARTMLQEKNINVSDALLNHLVSDDADDTKAAVDSFIALFQAEVSKAVKDALKGNTPKKGSESKITREEIMAVKDRKERQKLINENLKLFK